MIETPRTRLRPWRETDREAFASMLSDPEVTRDLGGPLDRAAADAKLDRYAAALTSAGLGRMAIEGRDGELLGYAGVMALDAGHPARASHDIGWRLRRRFWGQGFASEAAGAALRDAFARLHLPEVVAFTGPDNLRSQAVMRRLGMRRDPARDFVTAWQGGKDWHGLVWTARSA